MYKSLFIDLDDTLWDFSGNAEETFREVYALYASQRYFDSFEQFYALYTRYNAELWKAYAAGEITKDDLNRRRFAYPLLCAGVDDARLFKDYSDKFFSIIPFKSRLKPYAREALEYLSSRFRLYVLSNGFRELQEQKMRSSGILHYFEKVILSEDIGVHKPCPALFHFALSVAQTDVKDALMVGDSWEADIEGAHGVGMRQLFYNVQGKQDLPFRPTYMINDWREIQGLDI